MTVGNIPGDEQHNALKQKDLKGNTMIKMLTRQDTDKLLQLRERIHEILEKSSSDICS